MTIALYAGSFDPVTNGHLDLIKRSAKIFDKLVVLVANNTNKKSLFTPQERVNLISEALGDIDNVTFKIATGLTVDAAKTENADVLVRGVRNNEDLNGEFQIAGMNHYLDENIDTILIPTDPKWSFISSSLIKEVVKTGGSVSGLVPKNVEFLLKARLK